MVTCPYLNISHATWNTTGEEYETVVDIDCDTGYRINGGNATTQTIVCMADGYWSKDVTCQRMLINFFGNLIYSFSFSLTFSNEVVFHPFFPENNNNNNNNNNQSLIYAHIYIRPTAQEQKNSVQVIRNTAYRPSTQASYTASRVRLNKENQPWRRKLQPGSQYHFLVSAR